ncbi:uncharacterized protein N7482_003642 [Penicillium canariense]|uniref:Uncharacterized protein n=1 Tax=Penicillium canariense TaxID=189055 RepID=A0A9W9I737_9EURO|nr:uncharacterized protein N7482_003642 [Penicillium canariense]KAJ5168048.1 hypothetical protein N7482_003642 [Penicillium canariense]
MAEYTQGNALLFSNNTASKNVFEKRRRKLDSAAATDGPAAEAKEALGRERDEWTGKHNEKAHGEGQQATKAQNRIEKSEGGMQDQQRQMERVGSPINEFQDEDIQTLAIPYGTRVYHDAGTPDSINLLPAFMSAAREQHRFGVSNGLLKDDSSSNPYKSFVIVYRYISPVWTRRIKTLTEWEGQDAKFDAFNWAAQIVFGCV